MEKLLKILLLEDNSDDVMLLERELTKASVFYNLQVVESKEEFVEKMNTFGPDVILSDHTLPSFNSLEALKIVRHKGLDTPFILVTGTISEEFAVECMKAGADDYILKDSLVRLPSSIKTIFSKKEYKREKEVIENLHHELRILYEQIEEKNKSITSSINYAKRIQEAMLPEKETLSKFFPNSFIIYRPKDIVSGDFYWYSSHKNNILIAAADCTGHGVPGALMSIIGYNLLNEIVHVEGISHPVEILKRLDAGVRRILKQDIKENPGSDGMDIALCSIDTESRSVIYTGARRPLFYFVKNEFNEIKGDKASIGGFGFYKEKGFSSHELSFNPGDTLYLFTDGFPDQFGGKKGKKMMTKKFIRMLESTQHFVMLEQERVINEWFDKWKGDNEQTDDVLLIGIRF